jgi:hypothetical protein
MKEKLFMAAIILAAMALLIWATLKFGFIGSLLLGITYAYLLVGD